MQRTQWIPTLALTAIVAAGGASTVLAQADAADAAKGAQIYTLYCVTCHGEKGDGQGPVGKTLNPAPRDFTKGDFKYGGSDKEIFEVISNGAASKGGSALMAPWGAVIPEPDRWALVKHIRSLKQ